MGKDVTTLCHDEGSSCVGILEIAVFEASESRGDPRLP